MFIVDELDIQCLSEYLIHLVFGHEAIRFEIQLPSSAGDDIVDQPVIRSIIELRKIRRRNVCISKRRNRGRSRKRLIPGSQERIDEEDDEIIMAEIVIRIESSGLGIEDA